MNNLAIDLYVKSFGNRYATENLYLDYDEYAEDYDIRYETEMCRQENNAIRELLLSVHYDINITGKRILDLGCGTGLLLDLLGSHILQPLYTGIDICSEMIEKVTKKYPGCRFITDDAKVAIKKITEKHDIVVSFFSIPYIGTNTIEDAYNILKINGYFFTVYYRRPFLNPSSVYADKKEHYMMDVLPQVNKCIERADHLFKPVYKKRLTSSGAYDVALFQKT